MLCGWNTEDGSPCIQDTRLIQFRYQVFNIELFGLCIFVLSLYLDLDIIQITRDRRDPLSHPDRNLLRLEFLKY